jgi:hypothetical protein
MIAMIVLAGVSGALIIAFIVACCCCQRYQRKLMGGGSGTRFGKVTVRESAHWPVTACDTWGATPYGSTNPYNPGGDCNRSSAYDWALPVPNMSCGAPAAAPNPYSMSPRSQVKVGNEYGRVLLNPPSAVCNKPAMPSTKLAGACGSGGGCDGKFYQSTGQPLGSTAAQFVLESGASKHY